MKITPMNNHYVVELQEVEAVSAGGIALMSNEVGAKKTQGVVRALPENNTLKLNVGSNVVVAANGGHQDVVVDGKTWSLVAADNVIALLSAY